VSGRGHEIVLLIEGETETAVKSIFKQFLDARCDAENKPKVRLTTKPLGSGLLNEETVKDQLAMNLGRSGVKGVVALIDVVCSGRPQQFKNAAEAIAFLGGIAPNEDRYHPHAAQYDFEAWLLPYWDEICKRVGRRQGAPGANPENVNHNHPPSWHLEKLHRLAGKKYNKPIDGKAILTGKDLLVSARQCPQFKLFLNSLLYFAGCRLLP